MIEKPAECLDGIRAAGLAGAAVLIGKEKRIFFF
jgi:hypothetical protein